MTSDLAIPQADQLAQFGSGGGKVLTSLDLNSDRGKKLWTRCFGEADGQLTEIGDTVLTVTDYLIHDYPKVNPETMDVQILFRFCLLTKDGKVYQCGAETLLRSFKLLVFAQGMPPWPDGKKLRVKSKKLTVGKAFWFELA